MDKIKVIVVDDHPMVIEGMRAMLQQIPYVELCATATDTFMALENVEEHQPSLIIVDINLPEVSGIALTAKLKKEHPGIKVIGMSTFNERSYVSQMIQSGADGFLVKSASKEEIEKAISSVVDGRMFLSVDVDMNTQEKKDLNNKPVLTRREKEVLLLIAEGLTNPQIAEKLFISLHTVDSHRKSLLGKFEVNNTATLISKAVRMGLV